MILKILTLKEKSQWQKLIEGLPSEKQDLHFLPQYSQIYKETYGYEPLLAYYGYPEQFIIQPFVKRLINELPFFKGKKIYKPYYDLANPYGYGGPLFSHGQNKDLFLDFEKDLSKYFKNQKFASEFCSFHPLLQNQQLLADLNLKIAKEKSVVYFDLSLSKEQLWAKLSRGNKSSINKARKKGIKIEKVNLNEKNLSIFYNIYIETMQRNKAAQKWLFPKTYFPNCVKYLGKENTSLFFAKYKNQITSAYFLIHQYQTCYYHFGASKAEYFSLRPNNLLMFETALWAKNQGFHYYHLGGGVTKSIEDPLKRFKNGFSKKQAPLYTYFRILHFPTYQKLSKLKKEAEIKTLGKEIKSNYLPIYRR